MKDEILLIANEFLEKCNQVKSGKFLLSSDRVNSLLRFIASVDDLLSLISDCNANFCYPYELNQCISHLGSIKIFKLPSDYKKTVALVSGLLYEFDRRERDFHSFIDTYFKGDSANESFNIFCEAILQPYANAVYELLKCGGKVVIDEVAMPKSMSDAISEQLVPLVGSLGEAVYNSNLNNTKRKECMDILEGFYYAIESSDQVMVRAMWIGVKNTVNVAKNVGGYIKAIEDILAFYAII